VNRTAATTASNSRVSGEGCDVVAVKYLTLQQVAERLALDSTKPLLTAIAAGQLSAVNVSGGTRRATWRVSPADLADFLESRRAVPVAAPRPRVKKRRLTGVTAYF
jgi:hypothetical protein